MDEIDVDSDFHNDIFDISQSLHRIVRVSKGSNKKSFAFNLFQFCDLQTQKPYIVKEEVKISKNQLMSLVDSLRGFIKIFDKASKCLQIPLSTKLTLDLQNQKTSSLHITITTSLNIQIDKTVYRSN